MKMFACGCGVFVMLMGAGIIGAKIVGVVFNGNGYGALFVLSVVAGAVAALAMAVIDAGRDL